MGRSIKKACFLDRDGTLNPDPGYLNDPDRVELFDGVGEALSLLKKAGFELVIVTNQSGIGRGLIEPQALSAIHQKMNALVQPFGVDLKNIEICPHRPDERCPCRKPKPKLILDAAERLDLDVSQSFMVGDKVSDLGAGRAAGCRGVGLVRTGDGARSESEILKQNNDVVADYIGDDLFDVGRWILEQSEKI